MRKARVAKSGGDKKEAASQEVVFSFEGGDMKTRRGKPGSSKLTSKQAIFAREYLIDLNATQAAIRAGYSRKTAEQQGARLLTNVKVAEYIQALMDKRAKKLEITSERVLDEIAKLAFANLQDFYKENGSLKEIHELPRDVAAALCHVEVNLTEACALQKVKLHDKKGSLELLGKHLKLFTDKVEFPDKDGNPQAINGNGAFSDTERAARLLFLLEKAEKKAKL